VVYFVFVVQIRGESKPGAWEAERHVKEGANASHRDKAGSEIEGQGLLNCRQPKRMGRDRKKERIEAQDVGGHS